MLTIALQNLPKQQFTIVLDGLQWDVTLKAAAGIICADLSRAGEIVVQGARCVAGQLIVPQNLEAGFGNFLFLTALGDLPWWEQFDTQTFIYASALELAGARNGGA